MSFLTCEVPLVQLLVPVRLSFVFSMIKHDETIMFCDREHLLYCLEWTSRVVYTILSMHDVETVIAKLGAKIFGVTKDCWHKRLDPKSLRT